MFASACLTAIPLVIAAATVATGWWYERRFLPSIVGED